MSGCDVDIMFRGQLVTITDISVFEDMSVGIGRHVEDFRLVGPDGETLPIDYDTLTEEEVQAISDAVFAAERAEMEAVWASMPEYDEEDERLAGEECMP